MSHYLSAYLPNLWTEVICCAVLLLRTPWKNTNPSQWNQVREKQMLFFLSCSSRKVFLLHVTEVVYWLLEEINLRTFSLLLLIGSYASGPDCVAIHSHSLCPTVFCVGCIGVYRPQVLPWHPADSQRCQIRSLADTANNEHSEALRGNNRLTAHAAKRATQAEKTSSYCMQTSHRARGITRSKNGLFMWSLALRCKEGGKSTHAHCSFLGCLRFIKVNWGSCTRTSNSVIKAHIARWQKWVFLGGFCSQGE